MDVRLSPAQQRALLMIPVQREFIPAHTGFQWPTLAKLKQFRLINGVSDGFAGKGQDARHVITPRGLKLRSQIAASGTLTEGGDVKQAPGDSLSGPTAESRDAQ